MQIQSLCIYCSDESEHDESESDESASGGGFARRVIRMALPIQALMLLLLAAACLVPMAEEDFSCVFANNFRRSLDPMVRYINGTPPF